MIEIDITKTINLVSGPGILTAKTSIMPGSVTALYGESGVGKTTLLKILAGLIKPEEGTIKVNDQVWFDSKRKINITPKTRNTGLVFQDYALFPNMTIEQNVLYATDKGNEAIGHRLLEAIGLSSIKNQMPYRISGGQQQRVALARALAQQPKLLLLDEPLAALDIDNRNKLRRLILDFHKEYDMTTILVSHDIADILAMTNKVLKFSNGEIVDARNPEEAFEKEVLFNQYESVLSLFKRQNEGS